jgi:hypothetical protein
MKTVLIQGKRFSVDNDLNFITPDKTISATDMQAISKEYNGVNRIHKPMALLFWIDAKNRNLSNWTLI